LPPQLAAVLADAVVGMHAAFVVFVVAGGALVWRWPRAAWIHLPAVAWAASIELLGWICPLTPLENALRSLAYEPGYAGDFVGRYVFPILYPDGLTRDVQIALGLVVLVLNAAIYVEAVRRRRRTRERLPIR
jgi:hypothetical protein